MSSLFGRIQFNSELSEKTITDIASASKSILCEKQFTTTPNPKTLMGLNLRFNTPESINEKIQYPQWPHLHITTIARLDNREKLGPLLGISNSDAPDSEFIIHAYLNWGIDGIKKLKGDFAVVLHDAREEITHFFLSPLSPFSILYKKTERDFIYASTYKELALQLDETPSINQRRIVDHFSGSDTYPDEIFYNDINLVLPGHILSIQNNNMSISQYWHPNQLGKKKIRYKNTEDYYTHIAEVFNTAVKRRLRSNYPIASHLSGGLDSSSVSALAAIELAKQDRTLDAYISYSNKEQSVTLKNFSVDDRHLALDLVKLYPNIQLTEVPINDHLTFENASSFLETFGCFPRNVHNIGWINTTYTLAGENNARTFLTGTCGNLSISWQGQNTGFLYIVKNTIRKVQEELIKNTSLASKWSRNTIFKEDTIKKLKLNAPPFYYRSNKSLRHAINSTFKNFNPLKCILNQVYFSKKGIAIYDPTADLDLLDCLLSCPNHIFIHNSKKRAVIKNVMREKLPESILNNKERGDQNAEFMRQMLDKKEVLTSHFNTLNSDTINTKKAIKICENLNILSIENDIIDLNLYQDIKGNLSIAYALSKKTFL